MVEINQLDRENIYGNLNGKGFAHLPAVLSGTECSALKELYLQDSLYRKVINMERYRFGKGEYKYFNYPLPPLVQQLRERFYKALVPVANEWMYQLKLDITYPNDLDGLSAVCKKAKQTRPTPLILRYEKDGFNTLHQDLYGQVYFPFQVVFVLTGKGRDHEGGELVFVEQLPRAQSRAEIISPGMGDAVIFTTSFRPVKGTKGFYRAKMKHGISPVKSGVRYALGIIFHDAV